MDNGVQIKLNPKELLAHKTLYEHVIANYAPANTHEQLLFEHAASLCRRLKKMAEKRQQGYSLRLTGIEALAYMQMWDIGDIEMDNYNGYLICRIVETIDKANHQNEIITFSTYYGQEDTTGDQAQIDG